MTQEVDPSRTILLNICPPKRRRFRQPRIIDVKDDTTVLEAKREEFVDEGLIYATSLCEELEISFGPPIRIMRKHTFGDGSKDVQLSYEDDLRPEVILSMADFNLDKAFQDINKKEFLLERVCLPAFVAPTDSGCKKRTH
ncbi:uncharacterized protein TNCV_490291 [Trichonephila clavipes]|nr:uncharacterized protein TNCV_490291 [Trichonephila clavipes]